MLSKSIKRVLITYTDFVITFKNCNAIIEYAVNAVDQKVFAVNLNKIDRIISLESLIPKEIRFIG